MTNTVIIQEQKDHLNRIQSTPRTLTNAIHEQKENTRMHTDPRRKFNNESIIYLQHIDVKLTTQLVKFTFVIYFS